MLHFTRKGSSDVTGFQCLLFLFTWKLLQDINLDLNLESVAGFEIGFTFELKLNLKVG